MGRKAALTVSIRQAICADYAAGLKVKEIAEKYGIHRVTVSRVLARLRKDVPNSVLANPEGDYRTRLKGKAIAALEDALECREDVYKAGALAVQTLRGVGEFNLEDMSREGGVLLRLEIPKGEYWQKRYAVDDEPEQPALPPGPGDDQDKKE